MCTLTAALIIPLLEAAGGGEPPTDLMVVISRAPSHRHLPSCDNCLTGKILFFCKVPILASLKGLTIPCHPLEVLTHNPRGATQHPKVVTETVHLAIQMATQHPKVLRVVTCTPKVLIHHPNLTWGVLFRG